mmetsp:Transcript_99419/g.186782  ORF Transcript_99419/g.186782 Transcript_99419/m.186782 type:complete len:179 (-) Transcript_99419:34-570(-)
MRIVYSVLLILLLEDFPGHVRGDRSESPEGQQEGAGQAGSREEFFGDNSVVETKGKKIRNVATQIEQDTAKAQALSTKTAEGIAKYAKSLSEMGKELNNIMTILDKVRTDSGDQLNKINANRLIPIEKMDEVEGSPEDLNQPGGLRKQMADVVGKLPPEPDASGLQPDTGDGTTVTSN